MFIPQECHKRKIHPPFEASIKNAYKAENRSKAHCFVFSLANTFFSKWTRENNKEIGKENIHPLINVSLFGA